MKDPFALIRDYFKPAAATPDISGLAAPDKLAALLPTVITAAASLKLVPLDDEERPAFSGKDAGNQRQVSRGLLRLLERRPALEQAAGLDRATLQAVADKDEAFDLLYNTIETIIQLLDDGLLLLRAAESTMTVQLIEAARRLLAAAAGDPLRSVQLRVQFGALNENASALAQQSDRRKQRAARRERDAEQALAAARDELAAAPAVDRLIDDARRGRGDKR